MATTRIISMHVSHGKTIADCLTDVPQRFFGDFLSDGRTVRPDPEIQLALLMLVENCADGNDPFLQLSGGLLKFKRFGFSAEIHPASPRFCSSS